jgi:hypothetical protein
MVRPSLSSASTWSRAETDSTGSIDLLFGMASLFSRNGDDFSAEAFTDDEDSTHLDGSVDDPSLACPDEGAESNDSGSVSTALVENLDAPVEDSLDGSTLSRGESFSDTSHMHDDEPNDGVTNIVNERKSTVNQKIQENIHGEDDQGEEK